MVGTRQYITAVTAFRNINYNHYRQYVVGVRHLQHTSDLFLMRFRVICVIYVCVFLTRMPPPCSNVPAFISICHTLGFSAMYFVISCSFMSSLMLSSHIFFCLPFYFFFHALAYLASSWWYTLLSSFTRGPTIAMDFF